MENLMSYQSANVFPLKILLHEDLIRSCRKERKIIPIHWQLNPTNRCNFRCSFCSCGGRDQSLELCYPRLISLMEFGPVLGCKSVTITGGGEPLLHEEINRIIVDIRDLGIEIGLVTNGSLLDRLSEMAFDSITWIRISASDELPIQMRNPGIETWLKRVSKIVNDHPLDWSLSYVIGRTPRWPLIGDLLRFANGHAFTHVRMVNDILQAEALRKQIFHVREWIRYHEIDDSRVVYQDRGAWVKGVNPCYFSLLKPVIGPDGWIYPCCGTQYALADPSRDYEKRMRMGRMEDLPEIIADQKYFDGSICEKCYYENYNRVLEVLIEGMKHGNFV